MNENQKITAPTKDKQEQSIKLGNTEVTISAESVTIKADKININEKEEDHTFKESKLKVIYFDLEKKVFEVNGEPLPNDCDKLDLSFENGEWVLTYNARVTLSRR